MSIASGLEARPEPARGWAGRRIARMRRIPVPLAIRIPQAAVAASLYLIAAIAFRLQALEHLGSVCACDGRVDSTQFVWALEWWPHALLHGLNPVLTHAIYAPVGFNLAAGTSVPGVALLAAPITALAGPVVAYNVLSLLAPVTGAWFAYRLCLHLTRAPAASIIGGYLYGFSSFELGQLLGHLHTAFTFAAPAGTLLTLKALDGRLAPRRYALLLAVVLTVQLLISTEVELTLACMGAAALLCGWFACAPEGRRRIAGLTAPILAAFALTALLCSPYLYYELLHGNSYSAGWGVSYFADALNFVVPTPLTWIGGHALVGTSRSFSAGDLTESTAYLGPIQIGLVILFLAGWWRRTRTAKFLLGMLVIAVIWSLGGYLVIAGQRTISLPWSVYGHLPLFDQLLPVRLTMYVALICAVAVACWVAAPGRGGRLRLVPALAAVALLLPAAGAVYPGTRHSIYTSRFADPRFFAAGQYRRYLHRDDVVLPIPAGQVSPSLLWQARAGMYFRLASGYFGAPPSQYARQRVFWELQQTSGSLPPGAGHALRGFILREHVDAIVLDPGTSALWEPVLAQDGLNPVRAGGILLYRIPRSWSHA